MFRGYAVDDIGANPRGGNGYIGGSEAENEVDVLAEVRAAKDGEGYVGSTHRLTYLLKVRVRVVMVSEKRG